MCLAIVAKVKLLFDLKCTVGYALRKRASLKDWSARVKEDIVAFVKFRLTKKL